MLFPTPRGTIQERVSSLIGATVIAWVVLEVAQHMRFRAEVPGQDRFSAPLFVLGVWFGISASSNIARLHRLALPGRHEYYVLGSLLMMWIGISIRLWSFWTLGRFFTFRVSIQSGHRLITSGPYRFVRHPSYSGFLLALIGVVLPRQNGLSLIVFTSIIGAVIAYRIWVEEQQLTSALGDEYRAYARRTKRLVPFVV